MAKKPTKIKQTEAEIAASRLKEIDGKLKDFQPYPPASRTFKVGDRVNYGSHPNTEIVEVFDNGRVYEIKKWGEYSVYGNKVYGETTSIVSWIHLLPLTAITKDNTQFLENKDIQLVYSSMSIDSIISTYYNGLDMEPLYQRDYVWSAEDQYCLIDSIFQNRSIGSYILCNRGYEYEIYMEILDGKQRVKAIIDFFEDKFEYKGKTYSELSCPDRWHFDHFCFPRAELQKPTLEQKIKTFIHVNTTGKHMSPEHLEKVKGMLK